MRALIKGRTVREIEAVLLCRRIEISQGFPYHRGRGHIHSAGQQSLHSRASRKDYVCPVNPKVPTSAHTSSLIVDTRKLDSIGRFIGYSKTT